MAHNYVGKICPYCQYPIKQEAEITICTVCKIPHHKSCWRENDGCTTFGCNGSSSLLHSGINTTAPSGSNSYTNRIAQEELYLSNQGKQFSGRTPVIGFKETKAGIISFIVCIISALLYMFTISGDTAPFIIIISLIALMLGSVGLFQVNQKKVFAALGTIFSILIIAAVILNVTGFIAPPVFGNGGDRDDSVSIPPDNYSSINVPSDFVTIQEAIDNASSGQEIVVSEGIYRENINFKGKDIILRSSDPNSRDVVARTVIDAGKSGTVITFNSGESRDAVLSGFTITGGSGTREKYSIIAYDNNRQSYDRRYGGGILITGGSKPTIINNLITGNNVRNAGMGVLSVGGGIAVLDNSSPLIESNEISNNYSEAYGGGIAVWYRSSPSIVNNIIKDNKAGDIAGGILVAMMCSPEILSNTIQGNRSDNWSGGIYVAHMSDARITGNTVEQNSAVTGAGIFIRRTDSVTITDNDLRGNKASKNGGAVYLDNQATATVENNRISNNTANSGGAIWIDHDSRVRLVSPDNNSYQGNYPDNIYRK